MKRFYLLLNLIIFFNFSSLIVISECKATENNIHILAQTDLSPLDILIRDLQDVKRLIEEKDNKTAIVILKSSLGQVRKVKEFDKRTKRITEQRIKKGIQLLLKNKNQKALDLLQTAFDALGEAGLI